LPKTTVSVPLFQLSRKGSDDLDAANPAIN
jgi:hypothetical protein